MYINLLNILVCKYTNLMICLENVRPQKGISGLELPGDLGDIVAFGRLTSPYPSPAAKSKSLYFIRSRSVNYRRRSVK